MNITEKRTAIILEVLSNTHDMESCSNYGEPGYTDPTNSVLLANWNDVKESTQEYLEEAGFALEWSDEWMKSYEHDKAYRTQPDSHSWISSILITDDGDILTPEDASEWIEEIAITDHAQPVRALPAHVSDDNLIAEGYVLQSEDHDAQGLYGDATDPSDIARALFDSIPDLESVAFRITSSGQFDVWTKIFE